MSDLSAKTKEIEKTLDNICSDWVGIGSQLAAARIALMELKRLASIGAPPERKTGRWIDNNIFSVHAIECSECGLCHLVRTNFCPSCGADMRGEGEPQ